MQSSMQTPMQTQMQTHETVASFRKVEIGSNRKFGFAFSAIFCFVAVWPLVHHAAPRLWALPVAAGFLALALIAPQWLSPLNRAWFKFGLALSKVTSPIFMGVLFFGAVVPIGWLLRRQGTDLLALRRDPAVPSYWVERVPPGPPAGSLGQQF